MPQERDEILFGIIAVTEGFLTQEQLDQAVDIQSRSAGTKGATLGNILQELGLLQPGQVGQILAVQQKNLSKTHPRTGDLRADSLFGRLAVRTGFLTEARLNECLRLQAGEERKGYPVKLGRLLVDKKYLTEAQVREILRLQKTELIGCPGCGKWYNVGQRDLNRLPPCRHCGGALRFLSEIVSIDAEDLLAGSSETMADPDA